MKLYKDSNSVLIAKDFLNWDNGTVKKDIFFQPDLELLLGFLFFFWSLC